MDIEYIRIKDSVIEKIAEWLESNGIHKGSSFGEIRRGNTDGYYIDLDDMIIQVTQNDGKRKRIDIGFFWEDNVEFAESEFKWIRQYFSRNTKFTPFPKFTVSDLGFELKDVEDTNTTKYEDDLKDFIYKVDDTDTLKVQSNYESVESFFADNSDTSYSDNESIVILAVDTKLPIIKLEKQLVNNEKTFKFIVDIKTKDEDQFMIKTTIDSKEKFVSLLESTINSLKEFELFYKYADDLEKCL